MNIFYPKERNLQMMIYLLKAHHIRRVIVSPGTTNAYFVAGIQNDGYFKLYSCIDERSAAYMACGMAAECGEPVVLSCTMATAARNYMPGMTEAYYRKLPVLALTATEEASVPGYIMQQATDRTNPPSDVAKRSFQIPVVYSETDEWKNSMMMNAALIELRRKGGGPVHINMEMSKSIDFSCKVLPDTRVVHYFTYGDVLPQIQSSRTGIFIGAHKRWTDQLTKLVDLFCEKYNAVVLWDISGNYHGKYGIPFNLIYAQKQYTSEQLHFDLLVHIGEVSASRPRYMERIWRVSPDGEARDTFQCLDSVFEMSEEAFFEYYVKQKEETGTNCYEGWNRIYEEIYQILMLRLDEFPFSNVWIAATIHKKFLPDSELHLAILNSLRCYNMLRIDPSIQTSANTGGFGIDGAVSTLAGASLEHANKVYYGIVGDLAFFYDINALGNRHIGSNLRLMVINNGIGAEFKRDENDAMRSGMGQSANEFVAAQGHFGNQSRTLVKHYASDLGFAYICASSKEEFIQNMPIFFQGADFGSSVIFEVFTEEALDIRAFRMAGSLKKDLTTTLKSKIKEVIGRT